MIHRDKQKRNYNDHIYFITCNTQNKIFFLKIKIFDKYG